MNVHLKPNEAQSPSHLVSGENSAQRVRSQIWRPSRSEHVSLEYMQGRHRLCFHVPDDYDSLPIAQWGWERVTATDFMFDDFVHIESEVQALRFARTWGPLWVVEASRQSVVWSDDLFPAARTPLAEPHPWSPSEPLDVWWHFVDRARSTLQIATSLSSEQAEPVSPAVWESAGLHPSIAHEQGLADPTVARRALATLVNAYLDPRQRGLRLVVDEADLQLTVDAGLGFLPAFWLSLAQSLGRTRVLYICAACHRPFLRSSTERAPKDPSRTYCSECRQHNFLVLKTLQSYNRRVWLRELVDFYITRAGGESSTESIRIEWNDHHERDQSYFSDVDMLGELNMSADGSYNALPPAKRVLLSNILQQRGEREPKETRTRMRRSASNKER
jgi:hypothetical protein